MREDPIIFEDWVIGYPLQKIFNPIKYADFFISLVLVGIILVLGIIDKSAILLFGAFFIFIMILFTDLFSQTVNKNLTTNIIETLLLVLSVSFLYNSTATHSLFVEITLSFAYLVKFSFISGKSTLAGIYGELLIPRTESVQAKLQHQLKVLKATDFSLDSQYLKRYRNEVFATQVFPFIAIGTIFGAVYIFIKEKYSIDIVSGFAVFNFILLLYLVAMSLALLFIIFIWRYAYIQKATGLSYSRYLYTKLKSIFHRKKKK